MAVSLGPHRSLADAGISEKIYGMMKEILSSSMKLVDAKGRLEKTR